MRVIRLIAPCLLALAALAPVSIPALAAPPQVIVPILMYHHVGQAPRAAPDAQYYVPTAAFETQMAYLTAQGYTSVSIDQIAQALDGGAPLPDRPVAITFDDADQDNFDNAFPVLQKYHFFATFFIVTGWVGTPGRLTWDEIATLQRAGMRFGAHTLTHPYLPRLRAVQAWREITDSKAELEAHLGTPVTAFAYPYGRTSRLVTQLVRRAGFIAALGTSPPLLRHTSDELFYLTRLGVYRWTTFEIFTSRLAAAVAPPHVGYQAHPPHWLEALGAGP